MLLIFVTHSIQFYIKNLHNDIFMCDRSAGTAGRPVTACSRSHSKDFLTTVDKDGYTILKHQDSEDVLEIDEEDNTLKYTWENGGANQQFLFVLVSPSTFIIKNQGGCVSFVVDEDKYVLSECDNLDNQLFHILGHNDEDIKNKSKNSIAYNKNKGFPIYGDSESTYTSACEPNGHCRHRKKRIHGHDGH